MAANSGFPLSLDVKGYPVLVLGGDEEAAEKTQRLLEAGAKVTVVAPTLHDILKDLAASAKVLHRGRHFRDADLDSAILVLNMVRGDRDFSRALFREGTREEAPIMVGRPAGIFHGHDAGGRRLRAFACGHHYERGCPGLVRLHEGRYGEDLRRGVCRFCGMARPTSRANQGD